MNPLLMNPFVRAVKKYIQELIPNAYTETVDETVDRISIQISTQRDTERFMRLIAEVYQAGYLKAMEATQERLAKEGIKLKLVSPVK